MDKQEIMHYWYYFCSLCTQLNNTRQYVDHKTSEQDAEFVLVNRNTCSNEFLKILLSSASEFETIGKLLCKEIDSSFKDNSNIINITKTIRKRYPRINETVVTSDFQELVPLLKWRIEKQDDGNEACAGLDWWKAYTRIKHHRYDSFHMATLENCINALA